MSAFGQIVGRLGQAPILNYTNGGTPVVNLSVASNRQKKNDAGEKVSVADWYRICVFGRDAEIIAEYAKKGSALAFNGRLQTDSYTDREGQRRTSTFLVADSFEFVPSVKQEDEIAEPTPKEREPTQSTNAKRKKSKNNADSSDIPF